MISFTNKDIQKNIETSMSKLSSCPLTLEGSLEDELAAVVNTYFNPRREDSTQESDFENEEGCGDLNGEIDGESSEEDSGGLYDKEIEWMDSDISEKSKVRQFLDDTCGYKLGVNEKPCCSFFSEEVLEMRCNAMELDRNELDVVILGILSSCSRKSRNLFGSKQCSSKTFFYHCGVRVCKAMFACSHAVGISSLNNLQAHYRRNGLTVRTHGNKGRTPHHACSPEMTSNVVKFIRNYAEDHALTLPEEFQGTGKRMYCYCRLVRQKNRFGGSTAMPQRRQINQQWDIPSLLIYGMFFYHMYLL